MAGESVDRGGQEIKLTPSDLARSWLGHEGAKVQRDIASTTSSLKFNRTYQPTYPQPTTSDGGMDIADYQVALGEYNQWPEEQEELIEHDEERLESLNDKLSTILGQMNRVERGDQRLIDRFAKLETERRVKIDEKKRSEEELRRARETGHEYEGVSEVTSKLDELLVSVRDGLVEEGKVGLQGWQLGRYWQPTEHTFGGLPMRNPERADFEFKKREGPRKMPVMDMRVYPGKQGEYSISMYDFRNPEEVPHYLGNPNATMGTRISFTIREGKVFGASIGGTVIQNKWGYPEIDSPSAEHNVTRKQEFNQDRFNEFKSLLNQVTTDVKSPSPSV